MKILEKAILMYLYKLYIKNEEFKSLIVDKNPDSNGNYWNTVITRSEWKSKSINDITFSPLLLIYLEYFYENVSNEDIFKALSYLMVNAYIEQNERFIFSFILLKKGEYFCFNNDIIPLEFKNHIGF